MTVAMWSARLFWIGYAVVLIALCVWAWRLGKGQP